MSDRYLPLREFLNKGREIRVKPIRIAHMVYISALKYDSNTNTNNNLFINILSENNIRFKNDLFLWTWILQKIYFLSWQIFVAAITQIYKHTFLHLNSKWSEIHFFLKNDSGCKIDEYLEFTFWNHKLCIKDELIFHTMKINISTRHN